MRIYYNGKRLSNDNFLAIMFSSGVHEVEYNHMNKIISIDRKKVTDFMIIGFYYLEKTEKSYKLSYLF